MSFRWIEGVIVEFKGSRPNSKLDLVIVADDKSNFKHENGEPIQSTPGQRLACQRAKLVTVLLYELRRFRERVCTMRIDVPLIDTETYDDAPRSYDGGVAIATLKFSYSRGGEDNQLHTTAAGAEFLVGVDREAVEAARNIVKHQDVVLDKLENARWFFARIKVIGDSVKEIHPYIEGAANALFLLYDLCEQQEKCRNAARDLVEELDTFLEYSYEEVRDVLQAQQDTRKLVENMTRLLTRISNFIVDDNKGPWRSLVRDTFSSRYASELSAFKNEFRGVKEALGNSIRFGIWRREVDTALRSKLESVTKAHYSSGEGCLKNTRKLLLAGVDTWVRGSGEEKMAWIYGHAGSGKSALMNSIAEILESAGIPIACFFCKRDDTGRSDIHRILPTLSYIFTEYYGDYRGVITDVVDKPVGHSILTGDVKKQIELLFGENYDSLFPNASGRPSVHVILIDALDECRSHRDESGTVHERRVLLHFLLGLANSIPWIKIIIASRPEPDIIKAIGKNTSPTIHRIDINDDGWNTADDIRLFINAKASELDLEFSLEQVNLLSDRASGLFIWCSTVFKYIGKRRRPGIDIIDIILNSTSKADDKPLAPLYSLYQQVLDSAVEDDEDRSLMESVLSTIFLAATRQPLSAIAIADLVFPEAVEREEIFKSRSWVANMIEYLSAILYIEKDTNIVRTSHPSVLDFTELKMLATEKMTSSVKPFSIGIKDRHIYILNACFTIMNRNLCFNICELGDSSRMNKDVHDLSERIKRYIPEVLRYSSLFWLSHLQQPDCGDHVLAFLNSVKALFWIEILSLLNVVDHGIVILQDCAIYFEDQPNIVEVAKDWERLLLTYGNALQSTPHLYLSALSWLPENSRLTEILRTPFSASLPVITNTAKTWGGERWSGNASTRVMSVAYSPSGRLFAAGCQDGNVRVWEARSGKGARKALESSSNVQAITFSPDDRWLASGHVDGRVRLWNVHSDSAESKVIEGHDSYVVSVAFSSDGKRIVSGSWNKSIKVSDIESGNLLKLKGHDGSITSAVFSADDSRIISSSFDGTLRSWDSQTGSEGETVHQWNYISSISRSPDGKHIATSSFESIQLYDQWLSQIGNKMMGHTDDVRSICFSPDSKFIASGSTDRSIRVWDIESRAVICELRGHTDMVRSVTFSPDGQSLLSGSYDGTVRLWDFKVKDQLPQGPLAKVLCVSYTPDGNIIASGSSEGNIYLWDACSGAAIGEPLHGHEDAVNAISVSGDGKWLVSGSDDWSLRIWDIATGTASSRPMSCLFEEVKLVAISPDNQLVASASDGMVVRLWDREKCELLMTFNGHEGVVTSITFSTDSKWLASTSWDRTIRIWDTQTGKAARQPINSLSDNMSVAVSADGKWLASGSSDYTVRIWNTSTLTETNVHRLGVKNLSIALLAFSTNAEYLVSTSWDRSIRVLNVKTGKIVGNPINGHAQWISSVAFSSNGQNFATGSFDGTIRVWDIRARTDLDQYKTENDDRDHSEISEEEALVRWNASRARLNESDGWVKAGDKVLLWVPLQYRHDIGGGTKLVIGAHVKDRIRPEVNYGKLFKFSGTRWKDIYQGSG